MTIKRKRLLVLLLIILKETGPTAACSSSCSSWSCYCSGRGLTSVPQDLPTTISELYLWSNAITALSQSDFSRYSSLTRLYLHNNQISVINSGAFYNLSGLTCLYLHNNQLTSLRSDMFVGLDSLRDLQLEHNNIHGIEAGTFNATPQLTWLYLHYNQLPSLRSDMFVGLGNLQGLHLDNNNIHSIEAGTFNSTSLDTLLLQYNSIVTIAADALGNFEHIDLSYNGINTFPVEALSTLNISARPTLRMNHNQMETIPSAAYDLLASMSTVSIENNPWQCDCRMLPFKQKMIGFRNFEKQIRCAGPGNLQGKSLLVSVDPEDLICDETGSTDSTSFFSLSAFLGGFPGGVLGSLLTLAVFLAIWCIKRRAKTRPAPVPDPSGVSSNPNGAATGPTGGRHHTGQGASPSRAAHSDDGENRPGTSGTVPPPRSLDKSYAVLRAPLPPIIIKDGSSKQMSNSHC